MFLRKKEKNIRLTRPSSVHTFSLSLKHLHTKDGVCVCPHYPKRNEKQGPPLITSAALEPSTGQALSK